MELLQELYILSILDSNTILTTPMESQTQTQTQTEPESQTQIQTKSQSQSQQGML